MDLSKLIALLNHGCLFFSRADRLGDPWEGATSPLNITLRKDLDEKTGLGYQNLANIYRASRTHTYISCWHKNSHESAAMWRLYLKSHEGLAVRTTFGRLRESFPRAEQDIYIGKVHYYNPELEVLPEGNVLRPYLWKRKSFEHECEVRAVFQDPRGFEAEPAAEYGLNIPVDVERLVEEVWLAPTSPDWLAEVMQSVLDRFGLKRIVRHSRLDDAAVF